MTVALQGGSPPHSHSLVRVVINNQTKGTTPLPISYPPCLLPPPLPTQGDAKGWPSPWDPKPADGNSVAGTLPSVSQPTHLPTPMWGPSRATLIPSAKVENDAQADFTWVGSNLALKTGRPTGRGPGWQLQRGGEMWCPNPPGRQATRHGTAPVHKKATHRTPYHTHQVLYAASTSRIPQITGSKAIKQPGRRNQCGFSFVKEGSAGEERGDAFSLCYGPKIGIAWARASQNPRRPALTWDAHPGPTDQRHGGFEGVNGCLGGVTARLGFPVGQACGWER